MPIWFIIFILLSFTWLGYETNWMRVRLLVGNLPEPTKPQPTKPEPKLKPIKVYNYAAPWTKSFSFSPGVELGKEQADWLTWAYQHPDEVNPPCRIDLKINGNRYAMKVNKPSVLAQVIKVNTEKHHPPRYAQLSKPIRQDALTPLEEALKANWM